MKIYLANILALYLLCQFIIIDAKKLLGNRTTEIQRSNSNYGKSARLSSARKVYRKLPDGPKYRFSPFKKMLDNYTNIECTPAVHDRMDKILAELVTIGTIEKFPESAGQVVAWCSKAFQAAPFTFSYLKSCVSDFGKVLSKMVFSQLSVTFAHYCGTGTVNVVRIPGRNMRQYINVAKCANRAEDKIKLCQDLAVDKLMGIIKAPDTIRIKMVCCNSYKFGSCVHRATARTIGCSRSTREYVERQVPANFHPVINLFCAEHWDAGAKCTQLLSEVPKLDSNTYVRPKSAFIAFMKLMDSFPDVNLDSDLE